MRDFFSQMTKNDWPDGRLSEDWGRENGVGDRCRKGAELWKNGCSEAD